MLGAKVFAVIVTYRPDWNKVGALVHTISEECADYVIVDNSDVAVDRPAHLNVVSLETNSGIAFAQNVGIDYCLERRSDVIVFFDQDSVLPPSFLKGLIRPIVDGKAKITAPTFHDETHNFAYAILEVTKWGFRKKFYPDQHSGAFTTNIAISSGTAVAADVFGLVGKMDESLFIDFVDTEWCLRCHAEGLTVRIDPAVSMKHSIGNKTINFGVFRVPVHSPYRRYYRIRNSLLLLRMKHVPKLMALREIAFSLVQQLLMIMLCRDRSAYFHYMICGLRDGIINKRGKLDL